MDEQDVAQVNTALREVFQLYLGQEMTEDDLVYLLPPSIQESYSEKELLKAVSDYCVRGGSSEDGFVRLRHPIGPRKIFNEDGSIASWYPEKRFRILKDAAREPSCKLRNLNRIKFDIDTFSESRSSIEAERTASSITLETLHYGPGPYSEVETESSELSEKQFEKISKTLSKISVLNWDREYERPALDGTHWELELEFPDNFAFISRGLSAYPKGFNILLQRLIDCGLPEEFFDYEKGLPRRGLIL